MRSFLFDDIRVFKHDLPWPRCISGSEHPGYPCVITSGFSTTRTWLNITSGWAENHLHPGFVASIAPCQITSRFAAHPGLQHIQVCSTSRFSASGLPCVLASSRSCAPCSFGCHLCECTQFSSSSTHGFAPILLSSHNLLACVFFQAQPSGFFLSSFFFFSFLCFFCFFFLDALPVLFF